MGKTKETNRQFCERMVKEYRDIFRTDGQILFCNFCESSLAGATKLSHVKQHMSSDKHKAKVEGRNGASTSASSRQTLITEHQQSSVQPKNDEFNADLCRMFLEANIPLKKISHSTVVNFMEKYTGENMPSESTLRQKFVPNLYNDCMQTLREKVKNRSIWVSIDETSDSESRLVCNFIFGILVDDENDPERGKCYLLNMDVVEKANASTMAAFFNNSLLLLWPDGKTFFRAFFQQLLYAK